MKIELIYLWINRDKHRCFQQMGFNFSPQYSVSYFDDRKELQIDQLDKINVFRTDRIANVTAVIGENGTGKTTLLEYLTSLSDIPLSEENRAEYMQWTEEQNELNEFIAVYWDHEEDCPRIINITHDPITYNETRIQPQTANSFRDLGLLRQVSHIYLSNGAYENNQNLTEDGRINYVTITDKTLSVMFHSFYRKKYMFTEEGERTTAFNTLSDILSTQENSKSMQMLKSVSSRFFVGVRSRWAVCVPVTFKTSIPTVQRNWRSATTRSSSTMQTSAKPSTMPFGWRKSQ